MEEEEEGEAHFLYDKVYERGFGPITPEASRDHLEKPYRRVSGQKSNHIGRTA